MMKHLSAITLIILLLLISCRQERAVSPRLVELDSLIAVAPDSAAALLEAIPAASLHDPEDRAYHALLITQAKYKAYIPATSDSAINLAVDYYVT
ncbi:MAG: tetratricopeptide repeat protein, partial [Muribaculaceae bacterium]|nr:tetratricopeptide repeat protein [Muribaculaceae bacterium]